MVVYIEKVFLDNFILNAFILILASINFKMRAKYARISAASALGAATACLVLTDVIQISVVARAGISVLMCLIAFFKRSRPVLFIKMLAYMYVITLAFSGALLAMLTLCESRFTVCGGVIYGGGVIAKTFYSIAAASALLIPALKALKSDRLKATARHPVRIVLNGKNKRLTGYMDTGSLVREPETLLPVIFLNVALFADCLSDEFISASQTDGARCSMPEKTYIVPYHTAAGGCSTLALRADEVRVGKDKVNAMLCFLPAVAFQELNADAILPVTLMEET